MVSTITAIVSAYYADKYIDERLENLTNQTPKPEVIVVAEQNSYEAEAARVHDCILIQTNGIPTIYKAWNTAWQAAYTKYIVNANCDDLFLDGGLARMAQALDEHPDYCLVYGNLMREEPNGERRIWDRRPGMMNEIPFRCFVGPMPMWRNALWNKYGGFDEGLTVAGDYEYWMRLHKGGERFLHLENVIGLYRVRPDSLEHRNTDIMKAENQLIRERHYPLWRVQK
jgi:glycosyltransferase involved in cell wall biosynthesis